MNEEMKKMDLKNLTEPVTTSAMVAIIDSMKNTLGQIDEELGHLESLTQMMTDKAIDLGGEFRDPEPQEGEIKSGVSRPENMSRMSKMEDMLNYIGKIHSRLRANDLTLNTTLMRFKELI